MDKRIETEIRLRSYKPESKREARLKDFGLIIAFAIVAVILSVLKSKGIIQ
jgi:hypothetical protein